MLRSMYSGITGMKNFQVKLDVIGNNIANVNTYGYKKGRATFQDLVSQQMAGASAPGEARGGTNPQQIGLGASLASIDTIATQGAPQTTGRPLDLAISGDGYFLLEDEAGSQYYTRAGNFYRDEQWNIVNSQGLYLIGSDGQPINLLVGGTEPKSFSIAQDGTVNIIDADDFLVEPAPQITLTRFANPEGLEKAGSNLYTVSPNSGDPIVDGTDNLVPGTEGAGVLLSGALEMSNVDLSEEFTEMIVAQRGFQANTRIITTSDEILQEIMQMKR